MRFPVVVKPLDGPSGRPRPTVALSPEMLANAALEVSGGAPEKVMVEEFLPGREFSVLLAGDPLKALPVAEIIGVRGRLYSKKDHLLYSPDGSETVEAVFGAPADASPSILAAIEELAVDAAAALDIRDWCRVLVRCDDTLAPNVIGIDPIPGIEGLNPWSLLRASLDAADRDLEWLFRTVAASALERYSGNPVAAGR